ALAHASMAWAQASSDEALSDFSLSIGYSNVGLGSSSAIDSEGALRVDGYLTFSPLKDLPQLRIGGGVGVSLVLDDSSFVIVSSGGAFFAGSADIPLWFIEPELRLSWRQYLGDGSDWFIEPGVAAGWAF